MKKKTNTLAMATPCPNLNVKRPMSRGPQPLNPSPKTLNKSLLILTIFLLSLGFSREQTLAQAQAQQNKKETNSTDKQLANFTLKGKITDTQNNTLAGATITDTQSQRTAQSDQQGNFTLNTTTQTGKITITYLGYLPQTINYNTNQTLTIQLQEDRSQLQAVEINTGYYSVKSQHLTGAISSVSAKEIEKQPVANPLSALQGRITGAYIQQTTGTPAGNISIIIRGKNGIEATSNPLYLVDGIPFGGPTLSNSFSSSVSLYTNGGSSPLNTIAPEDIASIDILKDADATAIYGSRGANGVVLITTKKGARGKTSLEASVQSGYSEPSRILKMMSTPDYLAMRKKAVELDGTTINPTDYDLNGKWNQNSNTDWQKTLIAKPAGFSNYRAALTGGSQNHSFLFSATHHRQGTSYDADLGYQRSAFHLSTSHNSTDNKLSATASASYSTDRTNWFNSDLTPRAINLAPNSPALRNADGSINWEGSTFANPLAIFEQIYFAQNTNFTASTRLAYRPIKELEFSANLGYSALTLEDRNSTPVSYWDPSEGRTSATSISDFGSNQQKGWSTELQGSYSKTIGIGQFSLLLGGTLQQTDRNGIFIRGIGFASDALLANLLSATTIQGRSAPQSSYRYGGIYGRLNYTLAEKYILNLTGRRDGSSRFGAGRKLGNFGAIGAAYLFSKEKWLAEKLDFLTFGKLRASFGTSGNDQIGDYEYLDTYRSSTGYNSSTGLTPVRLFNPDFSWELNKKLEFGLDLGFFNDKFTITLGHYRNMATAQLVNYPLSVVTGFSSIRTNLAAKVRNTGWEVELRSTNIKRKNFSWSTSFNLTVPKNTLVSFPGLESSSYAGTYVIGSSLSVLKQFQMTGVDPQTGVYQYTDFNGDGQITYQLDRGIASERNQRYFGGLDNTFSYKGLELSFLFQFVSQKSTSFAATYGIMPGTASNQPLAYQGKYWTRPGDIAKYQRLSTGLHSGAAQAFSNYAYSDATLVDGSFVRLKNLSLAYRTDKLIPGKQLKFSLQGQNLWTLTNYFGLDPESANDSLPPLRTFTFGINLTL